MREQLELLGAEVCREFEGARYRIDEYPGSCLLDIWYLDSFFTVAYFAKDSAEEDELAVQEITEEDAFGSWGPWYPSLEKATETIKQLLRDKQEKMRQGAVS